MSIGTGIVIAAAWWFVAEGRADQFNLRAVNERILTAWVITIIAALTDLLHNHI